MNVKTTIHLTHDLSAGELVDQLRMVPREAKVRGAMTKGDRPWDSDHHRLELTYEQPLQRPKDTRPHSRACGTRPHDHGIECHTNCPTCHGVSLIGEGE